MKFTENWLRQHVSIAEDHQGLLARLTAIGLEVEDVQHWPACGPQVIVAQIIRQTAHPTASRLRLCQVAIGQGKTLQVVTGADNARPGLRVPCAQVGARLASGLVQSRAIKEVPSAGVLCSRADLGLEPHSSGLMELADDAPVGQPLDDYLGLPDAGITISLTPNRADCLSIRGLASDVAAACQGQLRPVAVPTVPIRHSDQLAVQLQVPDTAIRYCGRLVVGVCAQRRSPDWIQERLRRCGIAPVSLIVDITQYVMLEVGQPMHAYDARLLQGPLGVRQARPGERLHLLNDRQVTLADQVLVVTDADRPIALAGIMGDWTTRVTAATQDVFLEAAYFAPTAIAGRARRYGLQTDASYRFERGVDPQLPQQAMAYATQLLLEIAGGKAGPVLELTQIKQPIALPPAIRLRADRLTSLLGIAIAPERVQRILVDLGMRVQPQDFGWVVTPPSRRFDVHGEEDLIEEVARIWGYDQIPLSTVRVSGRGAACEQPRLGDDVLIRQHLVSRQFQECIHYSFLDKARLSQWGFDLAPVHLVNPLSAELAVMRPSLLPGLLASVQQNLARQAEQIRFFECGRVFCLSAEDAQRPRETEQLAAIVCGNAVALQWGEPTRSVDFFDLKGDLESIAAFCGQAFSCRASATPPPWAHPRCTAQIQCEGRTCGWIGQLHPSLLAAYDIRLPTFALTLQTELVMRQPMKAAQTPSRFPVVRRDISILVSQTCRWEAIARTIWQVAGPLLAELKLFDRYCGPGVQSGQVSFAIGFILKDNTRTLIDQDVEQAVTTVIAALAQEHGAVIRSSTPQ